MLFQPLEDAIKNTLIPALCGKQITPLERKMFALPYRHGGMGILNPTEWSQFEYDASKDITSQLSNLIYKQDFDISKLDREKMNQSKKNWKKARENIYKEDAKYIFKSRR